MILLALQRLCSAFPYSLQNQHLQLFLEINKSLWFNKICLSEKSTRRNCDSWNNVSLCCSFISRMVDLTSRCLGYLITAKSSTVTILLWGLWPQSVRNLAPMWCIYYQIWTDCRKINVIWLHRSSILNKMSTMHFQYTHLPLGINYLITHFFLP